MTSLLAYLRSDERIAAMLDAAAASPAVVAVPDSDGIAALLHRLRAGEQDIREAVAACRAVEDNDDIRRLAALHATFLRDHMGEIDLQPRFVPIPETLGLVSRAFYLYVYAAAFPAVRDYHARREVPAEVSLATLADLGRHLRVNRKRWGYGGLVAPEWLMKHFHGVIYDLGRLQFEMVRLGAPLAQAIRDHDPTATPDDLALSIHIPDFSGPMAGHLIDASLQRARPFFRRHYPGHPWRYAYCSSWLLDDQLPGYLPDTSNIVQFQRRFRPVWQGERNDRSVATFIWGARSIPTTPRAGATSLERAVIAHHQAGGHWGSGTGWLDLREQEAPAPPA